MSEIPHIKLSELTSRIENALKQTFSSTYWIVAEIAGHTYYENNDRHYFQFVEKEDGKNEPVAKIEARAWSQGSQIIKYFEQETGQKFTSGLQVLVNVRVEYKASYGVLQLILTDINREFTLGNLEKQRREVLARLVKDNPDHIRKIGEEYQTRNKSAKFNPVIQNIALIGSPKSQGYEDFTHTISANQFGYKINVDIYQSSVQGAGVENEIVNRFITIFESKKQYDAIVLIRGGGAKTDFLVFDTYPLARAVARFPIPVITGIGHHKDVSIVDLMAHTHTKTPTKAAEFIISHNRTFEDSVITLQKAVIIKSQQLLSNAAQKVNGANLVVVNKTRTFLAHYKDELTRINQTVVNKSKSIIFNRSTALVNTNQVVINKSKAILLARQTALLNLLNNITSRPRIITANRANDLVNVIGNLQMFAKKYFANHRGYVNHYAEMIKLMRPENILKKGFAIVKRKGNIIKSPDTITTGEDLTITMESFDINTKVISKTPTNG